MTTKAAKFLTCNGCGTRLDPLLATSGYHFECEPAAAVDTTGDQLATELFGIIADAITNQPRSLQTRIGPSELGVPCNRRIGYKLAGIPEVNHRGVAFKPWIGTQAHEGMAMILANASMATEDARWIVEGEVNVGQVGGDDITGHADLFDKRTGTVWDWKFTSKNQIREHYKPHGPGDQYRTQAHLYGLGYTRRGYTVNRVGIIFFTRDGEFTDRHVWSEPYDETVALQAIARADGIATAINTLGPAALPLLPMAESHCNFCPWHKARSTDLATSCPGVDKPASAQPAHSTAPLPVLG